MTQHHASSEKEAVSERHERQQEAAPERRAVPEWQTLQHSIGNQGVQRLVEKERLQRAQRQAIAEDPTPVTDKTQREIDAMREGGRELQASVKAEMEPAVGTELRNVRLHEGPAVESAARGLHARAFTQGSDIFLGERGHDTATLGHELTHVAQGGTASGSVQRAADDDSDWWGTDEDEMKPVAAPASAPDPGKAGGDAAAAAGAPPDTDKAPTETPKPEAPAVTVEEPAAKADEDHEEEPQRQVSMQLPGANGKVTYVDKPKKTAAAPRLDPRTEAIIENKMVRNDVGDMVNPLGPINREERAARAWDEAKSDEQARQQKNAKMDARIQALRDSGDLPKKGSSKGLREAAAIDMLGGSADQASVTATPSSGSAPQTSDFPSLKLDKPDKPEEKQEPAPFVPQKFSFALTIDHVKKEYSGLTAEQAIAELKWRWISVRGYIDVYKEWHQDILDNRSDHPVVGFVVDHLGHRDPPDIRIWDGLESDLGDTMKAIDLDIPQLRSDFEEQERKREEADKRRDDERAAQGLARLLPFRGLNPKWGTQADWEAYMESHVRGAVQALQSAAFRIESRRKSVFYYKERTIETTADAIKALKVAKKAGQIAASFLPVGQGLTLLQGAIVTAGVTTTYNAAQEFVGQTGEMVFSDRTEFDFSRIAKNAAKDAAIGFVGGIAGGYLGKTFGGALARRFGDRLSKQTLERLETWLIEPATSALTSPLTTTTRVVMERAVGDRKKISAGDLVSEIVNGLPEDVVMGFVGSRVNRYIEAGSAWYEQPTQPNVAATSPASEPAAQAPMSNGVREYIPNENRSGAATAPAAPEPSVSNGIPQPIQGMETTGQTAPSRAAPGDVTQSNGIPQPIQGMETTGQAAPSRAAPGDVTQSNGIPQPIQGMETTGQAAPSSRPTVHEMPAAERPTQTVEAQPQAPSSRPTQGAAASRPTAQSEAHPSGGPPPMPAQSAPRRAGPDSKTMRGPGEERGALVADRGPAAPVTGPHYETPYTDPVEASQMLADHVLLNGQVRLMDHVTARDAWVREYGGTLQPGQEPPVAWFELGSNKMVVDASRVRMPLLETEIHQGPIRRDAGAAAAAEGQPAAGAPGTPGPEGRPAGNATVDSFGPGNALLPLDALDSTNSPVEAARALRAAISADLQYRIMGTHETPMTAQEAWNVSFGRPGKAPLAWRDLYGNVYIDGKRVQAADLLAPGMGEGPPNFDIVPEMEPADAAAPAAPAGPGPVPRDSIPFAADARQPAGGGGGGRRGPAGGGGRNSNRAAGAFLGIDAIDATNSHVEVARAYREVIAEGSHYRVMGTPEVPMTAKEAWNGSFGRQGEPPLAWRDRYGNLYIDGQRVKPSDLQAPGLGDGPANFEPLPDLEPAETNEPSGGGRTTPPDTGGGGSGRETVYSEPPGPQTQGTEPPRNGRGPDGGGSSGRRPQQSEPSRVVDRIDDAARAAELYHRYDRMHAREEADDPPGFTIDRDVYEANWGLAGGTGEAPPAWIDQYGRLDVDATRVDIHTPPSTSTSESGNGSPQAARGADDGEVNIFKDADEVSTRSDVERASEDEDVIVIEDDEGPVQDEENLNPRNDVERELNVRAGRPVAGGREERSWPSPTREVGRSITDPIEAARLYVEQVRGGNPNARFIRNPGVLRATWRYTYRQYTDPPVAWLDTNGNIVIDGMRVDPRRAPNYNETDAGED
jgi:Domain of unknown function (DUF4157)